MSSKPDDLLSKADALMARHHPGRLPAARYAEIPVLDEVVDVPAEADEPPLLTEYVLPAAADEAQIQALMASMRARLLSELQPQIDALIAKRLKDSLAPLIEKLFQELRGKLQPISRDVLENAIRSAVAQELDRRNSGS